MNSSVNFNFSCNNELLKIPKRINIWAEKQPLIRQLLSCRYGLALQKSYNNLQTDLLYRSVGHGIGHIERVMLFGSLIAMLERLDEKETDILLLCCSYHDIGRISDAYDEEHGARSAQKILSSSLRDLFEDPDTAAAAIAAHSIQDKKAETIPAAYKIKNPEKFTKLLGYLKDADNIDRVRLADFNPKYMRNESSLIVSRIAEWVLTAYEKLSVILCFGDSNTYCYNPLTGRRYSEFVRWPDTLQRMLGNDYAVIPEGLNGRTTAFAAEGQPWKSGLSVIESVLGTHHPIDSLVIMLGINDCSLEFDLSSDEITNGLEQLICHAWHFLEEHQGYRPETTIISPPELTDTALKGSFGDKYNEKSMQVSCELASKYEMLSKKLGCSFIDLECRVTCSKTDGIHFTPYGNFCLATILYRHFSLGT